MSSLIDHLSNCSRSGTESYRDYFERPEARTCSIPAEASTMHLLACLAALKMVCCRRPLSLTTVIVLAATLSWTSPDAVVNATSLSRGITSDLRLARLLHDVGPLSQSFVEVQLAPTALDCHAAQDTGSAATHAQLQSMLPELAVGRLCVVMAAEEAADVETVVRQLPDSIVLLEAVTTLWVRATPVDGIASRWCRCHCFVYHLILARVCCQCRVTIAIAVHEGGANNCGCHTKFVETSRP